MISNRLEDSWRRSYGMARTRSRGRTAGDRADQLRVGHDSIISEELEVENPEMPAISVDGVERLHTWRPVGPGCFRRNRLPGST
jgi:hypothetical protein